LQCPKTKDGNEPQRTTVLAIEADRFGLELTHQNHTAATIFAEDAETGLPPAWDTFFQITQATHPAIAVRIEFANGYRRWENGASLVYSKICKSQ
jgi:STE24 endopeptidase